MLPRAYLFFEAVPTAMFGIVALWAAASPRHWFLRAAVALGVVSAPLMIPAPEVTFSAGAEMLLAAFVTMAWRMKNSTFTSQFRDFRPLRPRMSVRSLLLLTA